MIDVEKRLAAQETLAIGNKRRGAVLGCKVDLFLHRRLELLEIP